MRRFIILIIALASTACTTTEISFHSNPDGAEVFARPVGNAEYVSIGKTPLFITNKQLPTVDGGSGAVQVELRKQGYKSDNFVITETSKVNLSIVRDMQPKRDFEQQTWLNQAVRQMLEIRQMVQNNRYKDALVSIRQLKEQMPMVATLHQMEGGVLLLLKDYGEALAAYREAARLDPEDVESVKMIHQLEHTYGFRRQVDILDTAAPKDERSPSSQTPAEGKH